MSTKRKETLKFNSKIYGGQCGVVFENDPEYAITCCVIVE